MEPSPVIDILQQTWPASTFEVSAATDMPTIFVPRDQLVDVARTLRDHPELQFALLVDVTGVDMLPSSPRFEVVYHLACLGSAYGTGTARRLRIKVRVPGDEARVPTVTGVFPTAGWHEREIFDLFGIAFEGHPDLRRILTPEEWEGFPLRKDYPVQIRKDTPSWEPVQVTPEEFAETIRAQRAQATKAASRPSDSRDA